MLIEGLSSRQWKRRERQKQRRRKRKRKRERVGVREREKRERKEEEKKSTRAVLRHQQADKTVVAAERVRLDQR